MSRARPRRRTQGRHIFQGAYHRPKGEPLSAITRIEIARNDVVIREFASPTPGEELSYTDMPYQAG